VVGTEGSNDGGMSSADSGSWTGCQQLKSVLTGVTQRLSQG
jgi:hypothetical protein